MACSAKGLLRGDLSSNKNICAFCFTLRSSKLGHSASFALPASIFLLLLYVF
jgi:hypothetical protein